MLRRPHRIPGPDRVTRSARPLASHGTAGGRRAIPNGLAAARSVCGRSGVAETGWLERELPESYQGFPVRFPFPSDPGLSHKVEIATVSVQSR